MESPTKEGIYASSESPHKDELNEIGLGLTLLPGSQIQKVGDGQGQAWPDNIDQERDVHKELCNGNDKGTGFKHGGCVLREKEDQNLRRQGKDHIDLQTEAEESRHREGTDIPKDPPAESTPVSSGAGIIDPRTVSALFTESAFPETQSDSALLREPTLSRCSSEDGPACASSFSSFKTGGSGVPLQPAKVISPSSRFKRLELGSDSLFDEVRARAITILARDDSDAPRLHDTQKIDEDLRRYGDSSLREIVVGRSDEKVGAKRRLSDGDVGRLVSAVNGTLMSRGHRWADDVVRATHDTGFENPRQPPQPQISHASRTLPRRFSAPSSSSFLLGRKLIGESAREVRSSETLAQVILPASIEISRPACLIRSNEANISRSSESSQFPSSTACEVSIPNFSDTTGFDELSNSLWQFEDCEVELNDLLTKPQSAPDGAFIEYEANEISSGASIPTVLPLEFSTHQINTSEAANTGGFNTATSAQAPFTESYCWPPDVPIDDLCHSESSVAINNTQVDDKLVETIPRLQTNQLPIREEPYQSPYVPCSGRLEKLMRSSIQTEDCNHQPTPSATDTSETTNPKMTVPNSLSPLSTLSQVPHASTLGSYTLQPSTISSWQSQSVQPPPNLPVSPTSLPDRGVDLSPGSHQPGTSAEAISDSSDTSSDESDEEAVPPAQKLRVTAEHMAQSKKGLHAIASELVQRMHHTDIVPRALRFIKSYSLPNEPLSSATIIPSAEHAKLQRKYDRLREQHAKIKKDHDRYKRAADQWTITDPTTGLTKGRAMSREMKSLRTVLAKKTAEVEGLRRAWGEFEAARFASNRKNDISTKSVTAFHSNSSNSQQSSVSVQSAAGVFTGRNSAPVQHACPTPPISQRSSIQHGCPTPPTSQRVSVDLTNDPPQLSTISTPPSTLLQQVSSIDAAALRAHMKRKAYSWLPDNANHMAKRSKPAAAGSQPAMPIEIDDAGSAFDADAELEAEIERELLAEQQAEERERQRLAIMAGVAPRKDDCEYSGLGPKQRSLDEEQRLEAEESAMYDELFEDDEDNELSGNRAVDDTSDVSEEE